MKKYKITKKVTKIYDCYKYSDDELKEILTDALLERYLKNYEVGRTLTSYYHELLAHKRLYNLHVARSHTKDADLEENINRWVEFGFNIIGAKKWLVSY